MDNTLDKIHKFGKVAHILVTIVFVISIIAATFSTLLGLFLVQCKDISIEADNKLSIQLKDSGKIVNFDYDDNLDELELEVGTFILKDFKVTKDNGTTMILCESNNNEYKLKDFGCLTLYAGLQCIFECIGLFILKKICKYVRDCDSLFTDELVKNMYKYMYCLIPQFVLSLFVYYYQNQMPNFYININYGLLIEALVVYIIATIFKYGVKLQMESDETL